MRGRDKIQPGQCRLRAVKEADEQPTWDLSALSLVAGALSLAWGVAIFLPQVRDLPAWPAASVGVVAIALARAPGRALWRGLGAFLGFLGILAGVAQLLAKWGILELIT